MLEHGAKTPAGGSITLHLVGPIHTPMTGEEASLLGVLARTCSQEPICSRARKNLSLPGRSITPHRGLYPWLLTMTTHVLLHSAHRRTTLAARSRLHRRRTWTASHQALGGGAQGPGFDNTIVGTLQTAMQTATRLRRHHPVHSTRRRPAAGSCRLQDCSAWGLAGFYYAICCTLQRMGVRRIRRQHLLHSAGRRPAAGFGRLPSCSTLGVPAPTTPCCVICWQLSSIRLRLAVAPHCTMGVPPTALYAPPFKALELDHNLPYVLNPSHGPNTYTCSPLWRIHPQPGLAALILSAAID